MSQKAFVRPQSWSQTKRTTIRKVGQFRFSCAYAQGQCDYSSFAHTQASLLCIGNSWLLDFHLHVFNMYFTSLLITHHSIFFAHKYLFSLGRGYLPEPFRQIRMNLPELFRQIRMNLLELFRQIRTNLPE